MLEATNRETESKTQKQLVLKTLNLTAEEFIQQIQQIKYKKRTQKNP